MNAFLLRILFCVCVLRSNAHFENFCVYITVREHTFECEHVQVFRAIFTII